MRWWNIFITGCWTGFLIWKNIHIRIKVFFSYWLLYNKVDLSRRSIECQSRNVQQPGETINMKLLKMLGAATASYLVCVLVPLMVALVGASDGDLVETPGNYTVGYKNNYIA